jgi:bifunctional N-acetylglucosamine-1-phosphate-uridyltransferase/glucosamine-1-phosphate-acetyltransferase GlmU-like protein
MGRKAVVIETEEDDVRGINTNAQLAETEAALQQRLRRAAMEAGSPGRARNGFFVVGHHVRPRRGGGAVRGVRRRRHR